MSGGSSGDSPRRQVVVLAPMPLEMNAITTAFGLHPSSEAEGSPWTGQLGDCDVTAFHIGMGPALTRRAVSALLDEKSAAHRHVDHMMIAGICGGLDPRLDVRTLINPEIVIDHTTGAAYRHAPPGGEPRSGKLVTTENATLDVALSKRFFAEGCLGVDMESSAVAEVCEQFGCPWSVYRCIGDRYVDGLLDERIVAATNPDGSGNMAEIMRLIEEEPELASKLERLNRETTDAARLAAQAAARGCLALGA